MFKYMIFINSKYEELIPHLGTFNPSFVLFDLFEDRGQTYLKYFLDNSLVKNPVKFYEALENFNLKPEGCDIISMQVDTMQSLSTRTFGYFLLKKKASNRIVLWMQEGDRCNDELEMAVNGFGGKGEKNVVIGKMNWPDRVEGLRQNVRLPAMVLVRAGDEQVLVYELGKAEGMVDRALEILSNL